MNAPASVDLNKREEILLGLGRSKEESLVPHFVQDRERNGVGRRRKDPQRHDRQRRYTPSELDRRLLSALSGTPSKSQGILPAKSFLLQYSREAEGWRQVALPPPAAIKHVGRNSPITSIGLNKPEVP